MTIKKHLIVLALLACSAGLAVAENASYPRVILRGDYPDPTIMRDGSDYYMTHSSENYYPGLLIWHSTDLIHWEPICRALTKYVGWVKAPDMLKSGGKYYIYLPAGSSTWVITADNIRGPWSDPVRLDTKGNDPGHAVGEDGKQYLFMSSGRRIPLSDDGLALAGTEDVVYSGWDYPKDWKTEGKYLESPKFVHKGDYIYWLSAEGGTAGPPTSHMVIAARSKSINGPWENSPYNPIVHTYSADEPWWSKGHGTLIDDVNGNWWLVYHAYEAGNYPLGRMTLIDPIEWTDDGWFRVAKTAPNPPGEKPGADVMKLSDDFSGKDLGLLWTGWGKFDPKSVTLENNSLKLAARGTSPKDAQLLLSTATDGSYETEVEVTVSQGNSGGLILFYNDKAFAGISSDGAQFTLYANADQSSQQPNTFGNHFFLKIINKQNKCDLLASGDGQSWTTLQSGIDVSSMNTNTYKGFLALKIGLMSAGQGSVKFNNFVYHGSSDHTSP